MPVMDETISATEARRSFSRLLRGVQEGRSYLVTVHRRPLARIIPADSRDEQVIRSRRVALEALLRRTESQPAINIGKWTRDELYDRR
jgi:prevent-host-death family protein